MTRDRSIKVRIIGNVQGVGFRAWTERQANALGLSGWVQNCANGDVEAVFSGAADAVSAMLAACKEGPRHAKVERVELLGPAAPPVAVQDSLGEPRQFTISTNR